MNYMCLLGYIYPHAAFISVSLVCEYRKCVPVDFFFYTLERVIISEWNSKRAVPAALFLGDVLPLTIRGKWRRGSRRDALVLRGFGVLS
jgi:hypothetical protein